MCLTGKQLIGARDACGDEQTFQAVNPANGEILSPVFRAGSAEDVHHAACLAETAFDAYRGTSAIERGAFLEAIADELMAGEGKLVDRAMLETGLPPLRLTGELARTVNQLRFFSSIVRDGSYVEARVDRAMPERSPVPRPDIRQMLVALGPVAVFGASNFPLAFSVAGGDSASALAAGCPVVVKANPAHPGTSELAGRAIREAVKKCRMPDGLFSLIQGQSPGVGAALVSHSHIKAVAFTGSFAGGRALFDLAMSRPEPIPVYAEMGSVNPVFLLPGPLQQRGGSLALAFVESLTLGVGQFCTSPGLLFAIKGPDLDAFLRRAVAALTQKPPGVMLHAGIKQGFEQGVRRLAALEGVDRLMEDHTAKSGCLVTPVLWKTDVTTFLENPVLGEEVFGPSAIVVACDSRQEMLRAAQGLRGQLTATVHADSEELTDFMEFLRCLERKAGRLVFNGFPTGVEVCDAMHHGGPYPATTDSRTTSVGRAAIKRFLRPVCFQDCPQSVLPEPLQNHNRDKLWRRVDGATTRDDV